MESRWVIEDEWFEWYHLTPQNRWQKSQELWLFYLSSGGSFDTEPDSQSPFDTLYAPGTSTPHGGAGLRAVRRSGI